MPRELSKCRKWEKERRGRLNDCFTKLGKLLPCYDPSSTLSKIDILTKSAAFIEDLQNKLKENLTADTDNKPERAELKQLYLRVKHLLSRNEQLSSLLRDAGITIPSECGGVKIVKAKKWAGKITPEKAEIIAKIESQKENEPKKIKVKRAPKNKAKRKPKVKCKAIVSKKGIVLNNSISKAQVMTIANVQPCYFITNGVTTTVANNTVNVTTVTNTPIVSTTTKAAPIMTKSNTFPTGTIIFANSLPVVQPPTLLNPPIILNTTPSNTLIVVNQNKNNPIPQKIIPNSSEQSKINNITKTLSPIRPKRSITKTTHVNKVPIPASRYASNYILLSSVPSIVKTPPSNKILRKVVKKRKNVKVTNKRPAEEKVEQEEPNKKLKLSNENKEELVVQTSESKRTEYTIDSICKEKTNNDEKVEEAIKNCEDNTAVPEKDTINVTPIIEVMESDTNGKVNSEKVIIPENKISSVPEQNNTIDVSAKKPTPIVNVEQNSFEYNKQVFETAKCPSPEKPDFNDPPNTLEPEKQTYESDKILFESTLVPETVTKPKITTTTPTSTELCAPVTVSSESVITPVDPPTTNYEPIKTSEVGNKIETKCVPIEKLPEPPKPLEILHSELSNDIFASLQVPSGSQNPESTSPTAAFLNAFPLVSSFTGVKVTEVMEEETSDSPHGTPTLLQIGTMDTAKPTQTTSESLTPNLLNLDNFSFFSSKEICSNLYNTLDNLGSTMPPAITDKTQKKLNVMSTAKILYDNAINDTECLKEEVKIPPVKNKLEKVVTTATIQNAYSVSNTYSQAFYANTHVVNTTVAQVSTGINYMENKPKEKSSCSRYSSYNISEYNTFNPFTDIPKTTYNQTKSYNQAVYTNNTNCNYNYQEFNANYPMKNVKGDVKYYGMNYENYDNGNHYNVVTTNYYNSQSKSKYPPKTKANENIPRPPVNWMTAPDLKQQANEFIVPQFPKESEFTPNIYSQNNFVSNAQTTYFNSTASIYPSDYHNTFTEPKKLDQFPGNSFQRSEEDHQFTWSPTKLPQLLDQSHGFVTNTLPTLVGDLALGNTYLDKSKAKAKGRHQQNYDNISNFLSVSQLVDHAKVEHVPSRVSVRRNSGGRNKSVKSSKRVAKVENKEAMNFKVEKAQMKYDATDWIADTSKRVKNPPSSYSAEALIGQSATIDNKQRPQQQNYSKTLPVPSFLPDNLITYFPPVDIQQDNNFTSQQNQNYQNNTFTHSFPSSMQNNTYTGTFIPNPTTTYLPATNFIPEIAPPDFNSVIPDNIFSHSKPIENKQFKTQQKTPNKTYNNTTPKKSKKRSNNETGNFVDFSFLSMPGTINSPILPDDFHTPNFLPPPPNPNQLYSCKNPLYPKQGGDIAGSLLPLPVSRNNIQHQPEISPSLNIVGTSLTNFNLSTIFPEMNKAPVPDMYLDSVKNKDYVLQRSYLPTSSQIPFSKGPIYSSITTQSFTNS